MNLGKYVESKWLKPEDTELNMGEGQTVTIESFAEEELKLPNGQQDVKPVVKLAEFDKELILNKTNVKALIAALGEDTDAMIGKQIRLLVASAFNPQSQQQEEVLRLGPLQSPKRRGPVRLLVASAFNPQSQQQEEVLRHGPVQSPKRRGPATPPPAEDIDPFLDE